MDNRQPIANNRHEPFWKPWGPWGCLWRTLVFLFGMALISILLALLLRNCSGNTDDDDIFDDPDPIEKNDDDNKPFRDLPPELRDSTIVGDWNDSIPGVHELPPPEDNYIPPFDTTQVVPDPNDSLVHVVAGQLIVFFDSKDVKQDMASFARQFKQHYPASQYKVAYYNPAAGTMLLSVPQNEMGQVAEALPRQITGIKFFVTTNNVLNGAAKPADPGFATPAYDEYYRLIEAYDAWDVTRGSSDVKVAIVDSYFDLSNPEIGQRHADRINIQTKTVNVLPPARSPRDINELSSFCHGSHVAGLAIGGQNNQLGCSGIAPECSWIPIALGTAPWPMLNVVEGVLYGIYHGADVVNLSIGGIPEKAAKLPLGDQVQLATNTAKQAEKAWEFIMQVAQSHNCIIVKAAGNEKALMGIDYMNRSGQIVNVEAVDAKGKMAPFSNFGMVPEKGLRYSVIAAPGVRMWSASPKHCHTFWNRMKTKAEGGFQEMDGTSMACPVVAGAVALLKSKKKELTADQAIKILTMTALKTDTLHRIGPTLQIRKALDMTGGELANFDDLMKNHDLLVGKWRSTYELQIQNGTTGEKIDDMWTYFIFPSPTAGTLENHAINNRKIYTAPVTVKWGSGTVSFIQQAAAQAPDGDRINKDDFVCRPDKDRHLEVSVRRNGKERYTFQLEKVN